MNKVVFRLLLLAGVIFIIYFISCKKDEDVVTREDYIGNWHCVESSTLLGKSNYDVTLKADPANSEGILIVNFFHLGEDTVATATVDKTNITISKQFICKQQIWGSGSLSNNTISWSYSVDDGADIDKVTATYTKK
ncbi:MAG: hypothetical protein KA792_03535 [Bacteroidales bacterium]|nr:hypothetical protein [Bacteroidales bacterium]